ncbi:MAG: class I SAM-dependent methyltransferase [Nitrospirae bacterium]|nr:class I SAM-dependent methyltransferase [Nitrospirota bacterium]
MDVLYASKYHGLEENYWWFIGRRDIIIHLIMKARKDIEILEVGCSGGPLMLSLKRHGFVNVNGIDISKEAIDLCKNKGLNEVLVSDAENTGLKNQLFDLIIASDILEHLRDDEKALIEWHRILKPHGKLLIFVPAFNFLWSKHDEVNHHFRRYSSFRLKKILSKACFEIERISYWNFLLFIPTSIIRLSQRLLFNNSKKNGDQLFQVNTFINKFLEIMIKFENRLLSAGINFPFGVSLFVLAKKV